ncbi:MAG: ribonuclease T(2) [Rhizobium sp.]|nr:ribonuclease T(2) [Rhizobium sp.]
MGRYAGFLAFALLALAAALYGLLPAEDRDTTSPGPIVSSSETVRAPSPEISATPAPQRDSTAVPQGQGFDFYVLSLSWSPTFCDSDAGADNPAQCGSGKRFGWVVHGLWPQNERGYPQDCETAEGSRVADRIARGIMDIMPGMGLIGHQWRKHGSCSGLSMADYFSLVREAYETITIPPQFRSVQQPMQTSPAIVEQAFIRSNPGLTRSAVAVTCDRQRIDEVRICLDTSLRFRACPEVDGRSCKRSDLTVPPQP